MDWAAEGLLEGLGDDARAARERLLDKLHGDGVTIDELRTAAAEDRLVLLPIERALLGPARYTLAELTERGGVPPEVVERRLRTLGVTVPDDADARAFSDEDVDMVRRAKTYIESGMDLNEARAVSHLLSGLMARAAGPLRELFAGTYLEPGDTEGDLGLRYGEMAERLQPLVAADLDYLLRMHLREYARSDAIGFAARAAGKLPATSEIAVAFADIVGFTALGEELPSEALTDIAAKLETLADEHVRPPVRVVKTIGDAVMVAATDAAALVEAMVCLMEAAEATDDLPSLRTGIAYGRAVARLGDWYGPAVNLAARLVARARPDSILVTNALHDALADAAGGYSFSEAGLKRFKGIADPVPVLRLRRAATDA